LSGTLTHSRLLTRWTLPWASWTSGDGEPHGATDSHSILLSVIRPAAIRVAVLQLALAAAYAWTSVRRWGDVGRLDSMVVITMAVLLWRYAYILLCAASMRTAPPRFVSDVAAGDWHQLVVSAIVLWRAPIGTAALTQAADASHPTRSYFANGERHTGLRATAFHWLVGSALLLGFPGLARPFGSSLHTLAARRRNCKET
jgi:hypothetical protein